MSEGGARPLRLSRRGVIWLAAVVAILVAGAALRSQDSAVAAEPTVATAKEGPIVVTVGGVGQIVDGLAQTASQPSASGTATALNTVYPNVAGTLTSFELAPGDDVTAGQAVAVIDDGGAAAAALRQAEIDLETARLEVPTPTSAGALAIARRNVALARQRLTRVLAPPDPTDIRVARAEVEKARADLAALRVVPPGPAAESIEAARAAVAVAEERLVKLAGPPDPVAIAAAEAELRKAEADLDALVRTSKITPVPPKQLDAARAAVAAAQAKLDRLKAPADPADVKAAELELIRARAELAALFRTPPPATEEAIASAERAIDAAEAKLQRVQRPAAVSDVTAARLELQRAKTELRNLQATMRRAGSGSDLASRIGRLKIRTALSRLDAAQSAAARLVVRSPWSGTVSSVFATPGSRVEVTTPILAVSDLENLAVVVNLSEFDVAQVEEGMKAVVSVDALGGEGFSGEVEHVALVGVSTGGGVVTYPVRVALDESEDLKPGMNTSVRIVVAKKTDAVTVPLEAVTTDDEDQAFVTVLDAGGNETEVEVETGLESSDRVEIVEGIEAGTKVVIPEAPAAGEEE